MVELATLLMVFSLVIHILQSILLVAVLLINRDLRKELIKANPRLVTDNLSGSSYQTGNWQVNELEIRNEWKYDNKTLADCRNKVFRMPPIPPIESNTSSSIKSSS